MSVDHKRHTGDLLRPIRVTLLNEDQTPARLHDSTNAPPVVRLKIRRSGATAWHTPEHPCEIEETVSGNAMDGRVAYYPSAGDFDIPGVYETLFHFVWQGGEPEHFPREGFYLVEVGPS